MKIQKVIWKDIDNSKGYQISNNGIIKRRARKQWCVINNSYSFYKERIISQTNNNSKEYYRVGIVYDGTTKQRHESVHRLVAIAFVPNPLKKLQVNHIDGVKSNNNFGNLEWVTNQENMDHRYKVLKKFVRRVESSCNFTKLTSLQVKEIAVRIKSGEPHVSIVKDYPVKRGALTELKKGRSWQHLNLFPVQRRKSQKYDK